MTDQFVPDRLVSPLLAALPTDEGGYFAIWKIIIYALCVVLWAHTAAWSDKDLRLLRVPLGFWVPAIFFSGVLGLVLWLVIPLYFVGILIFAVTFGPAAISYVVFRNRRVAPAKTVLTSAHIKRIASGRSKESTEEALSGKDRTRIKGPDGKQPAWPTDPTEHAAYQATQDLLFDSIWRRASDVLIDMIPNEPLKIMYKIDGVDRTRDPLDPETAPRVIGHLKRISGLNVEEHRRPQQGKFKATIGAGAGAERTVDVDVKTSGSTAGERMLLKMFSEEAKFRIPDLGFTKAQLPVFEEAIQQPKGVVIVSGPRGSGVTSSLYAILRSHDAFMQNIHSLELSKSMDLENITQHVYDSSDGTVSFGRRFRSILRTEPDIVMAGDTPDAETAALAAAAGRQGKKVYLGMNASDTFVALRRYLQSVNDNALAASSLIAITSQRLARVLCAQCRRAYKPDPNLLKKANLAENENRPFYKPPNPDEIEVDKQGNPILCPACQGSGYIGRTAIIELFVPDQEIRNMVAQGAPLPSIKAEARKRGMLYLQEVGLHKVYEGQTAIAEILRVTKEA
ncbi:MAG: Flp pilus assembly complex ATPase component TadA [Phycisphaerae bacterium]|nr:Flp pilus assembly complex ATPase component TadA [Phycisphaerae bacterium]